MGFIAGRVVVTPSAALPYKVVFEQEGNGRAEHPVATVREGEALIRARIAIPVRPTVPMAEPWNPKPTRIR
jgi:hypothetical protein